MTYLKQIDSFRFFAAFSVLLAHWLHTIPIVEELKLGFIGVDFFFVVSGFLISYQLYGVREEVKSQRLTYGSSLKNFFIKRSFRIFPLYFVIVILATTFNSGQVDEAFIYNMTFTTNFYFIKIQEWSNIFSQFWSLAVEEHFYLFWPLIVITLPRKFLIPALVSIYLLSLGFRAYVYLNGLTYFHVYIHTLACLDVFMAGGFLAFLYRYRPKQFMKIFSNTYFKWGTALFFLGIYAVLLFGPEVLVLEWVFMRTVFGITFFAFIGFLVIGFKGLAGTIFENKVLIKLGKLSYAIYLIHGFVPGILLEIKQLNLPLGVEFIIYFISTVLGAELLYRLIEKPMRNFGKRLVKQS